MIAKLANSIFSAIYSAIGRRDHESALRLSRRITPIVARPMRFRRRKNLRLLYPDLTRKKRSQIERLWRDYDSLLRVHMARAKAYDHRDDVDVEGIDLMKVALEGGKGALVVGGHSGTWFNGPSSLALWGIKTNIVVSQKLFSPIVEHLERMAEHFGIKVILVGGNAHEQVQEALERGEAVYLNVDVSLRPERSPQKPLLGATLPMDPAPALLALIQGAPVFWASCFHTPDQQMAVTFKREPSFGHEGELSTRDEVLNHWAGRLSEDLTAHPEQWWPLSFLILEEGAKQTTESSD